jgi:hypothetical protein
MTQCPERALCGFAQFWIEGEFHFGRNCSGIGKNGTVAEVSQVTNGGSGLIALICCELIDRIHLLRIFAQLSYVIDSPVP